ncbi:MAG: NAD(P)H-hydrate epimerase [Candidatus Omnitrophica bacterium]|nr:NAD(P)H-hydrate epimerase [Candidatus Omnitrophota bacterium]
MRSGEDRNMRYVTSREMKGIDRRAIEDFGIPSLVLMENAGRGAAEAVLGMVLDKDSRKVICVCGRGNNGGDGFVCVRHLINSGVEAEVFLIGEPSALKGEAKINFDILRKMKAKIRILETDKNFELFEEKLKNTQLIIDAIFGIGLSGEVKEPYDIAIRLINQSNKPILAIDVPSGLDADTGSILGVCIKAKKTVTFGLPKTGFIKNDGPSIAGELIIADISIPKQLLKKG